MLGRSGVAGKCFGGSQDLHEADMTLVAIFAYHERVRFLGSDTDDAGKYSLGRLNKAVVLLR